MSTTAEKAPETTESDGRRLGWKKLVLLAVALLLVAGAAYWFLLRPSDPTAPPEPGEIVNLDATQINLADGHYLLGGLVQDFRRRYPDVRVRVVGQNSAEVADAVREGVLEAGLIALPVDDGGLEVRPSISQEIHYVSASPQRTAKPKTIEELAAAPLILFDARWGPVDPMRRLLAERAQKAGVRIEPQIEVEYLTAALDLAARRLGDTIADPGVLVTRGYAGTLFSVSFDPPLYDTFAFITRRNAHLSPATRAFMELAEKRVAEMGTGS